MAVFAAGLVVIASRWIPRTVTWAGFALLSIVVLVMAFSGILPSRQLPFIVGEEASHEVRIERFHTLESFGEGRTFRGVLKGREGVASLVREAFPDAKFEANASSIHRRFRGLAELGCPDTGAVLRDDHRAIIIDVERSRLYFEYATHPHST